MRPVCLWPRGWGELTQPSTRNLVEDCTAKWAYLSMDSPLLGLRAQLELTHGHDFAFVRSVARFMRHHAELR